jgi:hypothetical protein
MNLPPELDDALTWDVQGHLAEPAVTALADGELALLSQAALAHAESCAVCTERVGRSALQAVALSDALVLHGFTVEPRGVVERVRGARPAMPSGWLAAALVVATLGAVPNLGGVFGVVRRAPELVARALPTLAHVALLVQRSAAESPALSAVRWLSALLLVGMGIVIARLEPRAFRRAFEKGVS